MDYNKGSCCTPEHNAIYYDNKNQVMAVKVNSDVEVTPSESSLVATETICQYPGVSRPQYLRHIVPTAEEIAKQKKAQAYAQRPGPKRTRTTHTQPKIKEGVKRRDLMKAEAEKKTNSKKGGGTFGGD